MVMNYGGWFLLLGFNTYGVGIIGNTIMKGFCYHLIQWRLFNGRLMNVNKRVELFEIHKENNLEDLIIGLVLPRVWMLSFGLFTMV